MQTKTYSFILLILLSLFSPSLILATPDITSSKIVSNENIEEALTEHESYTLQNDQLIAIDPKTNFTDITPQLMMNPSSAIEEESKILEKTLGIDRTPLTKKSITRGTSTGITTRAHGVVAKEALSVKEGKTSTTNFTKEPTEEVNKRDYLFSLSLKDFNDAVANNPEATRFILLEEGDHVSITAQDDINNSFEKNDIENQKILRVLKDIIATRFSSTVANKIPELNQMAFVSAKALSAAKLSEILAKVGPLSVLKEIDSDDDEDDSITVPPTNASPQSVEQNDISTISSPIFATTAVDTATSATHSNTFTCFTLPENYHNTFVDNRVVTSKTENAHGNNQDIINESLNKSSELNRISLSFNPLTSENKTPLTLTPSSKIATTDINPPSTSASSPSTMETCSKSIAACTACSKFAAERGCCIIASATCPICYPVLCASLFPQDICEGWYKFCCCMDPSNTNLHPYYRLPYPIHCYAKCLSSAGAEYLGNCVNKLSLCPLDEPLSNYNFVSGINKATMCAGMCNKRDNITGRCIIGYATCPVFCPIMYTVNTLQPIVSLFELFYSCCINTDRPCTPAMNYYTQWLSALGAKYLGNCVNNLVPWPSRIKPQALANPRFNDQQIQQLQFQQTQANFQQQQFQQRQQQQQAQQQAFQFQQQQQQMFR